MFCFLSMVQTTSWSFLLKFTKTLRIKLFNENKKEMDLVVTSKLSFLKTLSYNNKKSHAFFISCFDIQKKKTKGLWKYFFKTKNWHSRRDSWLLIMFSEYDKMVS